MTLFNYQMLKVLLLEAFLRSGHSGVCISGRKKQKKFAKKACQQSAARPHDMVSCRRNLNNGGVIHDFSNGNSLKQNSDISTQRLGVDPNPDIFSVTITTEGRKAKSSAAEKMALCAEYYKLPHERYRVRKAVKKSSQSHQNPNTVKLNSSVNQSRAVVGATNMKVALTSCVTPMVKQGKALVNAHLSNSYPQVQGTKTVPSTTCKKKLDFLQPSALLPVNGQHPNDTFTASSSSPRSSPLLLPSPPQSHEPLLTQYTSSDTISSEQSEVEIIDVEGTSSVVAYKPVLKEFSIPLARITYQTI